MLRFAVFSTLVFAICSTSAYACKPRDPNLNFDQALMREPVIFIGKILSIENGEVSVFVEHPFSGVMAGGYVTEIPPTTMCRIFTPQIGQRWFFAGMFEPSPTFLLQDAPSPDEPRQQVEGQPLPTAKLIRIDDSKVNMPAEYQECQESSECIAIPYKCSQTSVNRIKYEDAQQTILQRGLRPKTRGCHPEPSLPLPWPICQEGVCGIYELREPDQPAK